jgi:hypothetical protein
MGLQPWHRGVTHIHQKKKKKKHVQTFHSSDKKTVFPRFGSSEDDHGRSTDSFNAAITVSPLLMMFIPIILCSELEYIVQHGANAEAKHFIPFRIPNLENQVIHGENT